MQILNTIPVMIEPWYLSLALIILISSIVLAFALGMGEHYRIATVFVVVSVLTLIGLATGLIPDEVQDDNRNQYEVIFDEGNEIADFLSKYDVIEQRGSVFIIQDKER